MGGQRDPYALPHQHPDKDLAQDLEHQESGRASQVAEEEEAQAGEGPQKADGGG